MERHDVSLRITPGVKHNRYMVSLIIGSEVRTLRALILKTNYRRIEAKIRKYRVLNKTN